MCEQPIKALSFITSVFLSYSAILLHVQSDIKPSWGLKHIAKLSVNNKWFVLWSKDLVFPVKKCVTICVCIYIMYYTHTCCHACITQKGCHHQLLIRKNDSPQR